MAERRLCLGLAGVINCTLLSALSFWVSVSRNTWLQQCEWTNEAVQGAFLGLRARIYSCLGSTCLNPEVPGNTVKTELKQSCFLGPETCTFRESDRDQGQRARRSSPGLTGPRSAPTCLASAPLRPWWSHPLTITPHPMSPVHCPFPHAGLSELSGISSEASCLPAPGPETLLEALNPCGIWAGCLPLSPPGGSWPWGGRGCPPWMRKSTISRTCWEKQNAKTPPGNPGRFLLASPQSKIIFTYLAVRFVMRSGLWVR